MIIRTRLHDRPGAVAGYALILAMGFAGVSLFLLAAVLNWTWSSTRLTERNNTYNRAVSAAEAGTEAVMAGMDRDFQCQSLDFANIAPYRTITPSTYASSSWVNDYQFCDTNGIAGYATLDSPGSSLSTNMDPQLPGLYGMTLPCRVISVAKRVGSPGYDVGAAVRQDFELASIPIFQFQSFSSMDLEICPGPIMKITGKVHGNGDLYLAPGSGLEFVDAVDGVGKFIYDRNPNDPQYGSTKVMPVFDSVYTEGASSLSLPIGTNNSPSEVVKVLDPAPAAESPTSPLGAERYYNKVDLILTISPLGVASLQSGRWNGLSAVLPDVIGLPSTYSFVKTDSTFKDDREGKNTILTDFDVGLFNQWLTNSGKALNSLAVSKEGHQINSIYVNDQRVDPTKLTGVRVINGVLLPPDGLTVSTYLPLYVKGHFNAPDLTPASTNTTLTKPASLVGDSITILSASWDDAKTGGGMTFKSRLGSDTTVNAAFLAGIVPTTNVSGIKHYSGGLENFPRLLEEWTGKTLTYNGSMVMMFPSRYATSYWIQPGTYYNPPIRKWAFDLNFLNMAKLPPVTPQVRKVIRGQWTVIAATGS